MHATNSARTRGAAQTPFSARRRLIYRLCADANAQTFNGCQNDWGVNKWKGLQFRRCYYDYQACRQKCFPSQRDYCAGC